MYITVKSLSPDAGIKEMSLAALDEYYEFADFRLYPARRSLLRDDDVVAIGGRAFDLLLVLVANAGAVVSHRVMMSFAWPGVTVEETNLRVQIALLRKALSSDAAAARTIETVPNRGYCFVIPVRHYAAQGSSDDVERKPVGGLPVLLSPVIGREEALAAVSDALAEHRLVTITGPAGIGKTTLAIAAAAGCAAAHDGPAVFVDLSNAVDGDTVGQAIASALMLPSAEASLAALTAHLGEQKRLVVLDTCEHIVEPVAALAELLLASCPRLRLIVTSREALRANGEWTYRLSSLSYPDDGQDLHEAEVAAYSALVLFVSRVRSLTRFELRRGDLPLIAEICRRLDGIPLALEFAAARVPDLGLHEISARLEDCFTILTRGRRTAMPRHRTMSAALDWSYGLLSPDEQLMLRHLANLDGDFTAERAIAGGSDIGCERPPDALAGLFEKSLISVDIRNHAPIYRLYDTTRAYIASMPVN